MLSQVIVAALAASLINAVPFKTERKCTPIQHEVVVLGKIAQDVKGQPQVVELSGVFSADYKVRREALKQSVFVGGTFFANYTYLRTTVSRHLR